MIIGLTGYAQSGKDTVANILVENYGFKRVAFADPIRKLLYEANPAVKDGDYRLQGVVDGYGWDVAKTAFPEVRRLLQDLGVGARKVFGENFWVDRSLSSIFEHENAVITDVRFINEAEMVKHQDGQIWRIKRIGVAAVNEHVSEQEMDGYKVDQIFANNGSIEDLELMVKTRMQGVLSHG
jgi:hypothetical protein